MKILVIDDDEALRSLLGQILQRAGHEVREAANGAIGLQEFRREPADLVITDLIMPEKEGLETILELRKQFPQLPLIAVSGGGRNGPSDYLAIAKRLGVRQTICKPFSRDEILQAVKAALE
jgi:DNA-binding response OmpR family regulator